MKSSTVRRGLEWANINVRLLLLCIPLLIAPLLILACSPYASQSILTTPPTTKQYYLSLPPDEVKYLFLLHISSLIPDEYAQIGTGLWSSSAVKDVGRGDWMIYTSWQGTSGTWKMTHELPFEFTFLRWDAGAKFIEDAVLSPLWERPNLSDLTVLGREAYYTRVRRPIDAYRAVLQAVNAEANNDRQKDWLRGRADGLSEGIKLRYEVHAVE